MPHRTRRTNNILNKKITYLQRYIDGKKDKDKPSPFEITSTIINVILAFVSTALALLTFSQQQDIKGMSDLLLKQDTLIKEQQKFTTFLARLTVQNNVMIKKLDTSQKLIIEQNKITINQTDVAKYSSKPLINKNNVSYLAEVSNDKYLLTIGFKNSGYRPAERVLVKTAWVNIKEDKVVPEYNMQYLFPEALQPGQEQAYRTDTLVLNAILKNEFENMYTIYIMEYYDGLTNRKEKNIMIGKQFKEIDGRLNYSYPVGRKRQLLENYANSKEFASSIKGNDSLLQIKEKNRH